MLQKVILAGCVLMGLPWAVAGASELTPFIGYRVGGEVHDMAADTRLSVHGGGSYGLIFDWNLDKYSQVELLFSRQDTQLENAGSFAGADAFELNIDHYHLGGAYVWPGQRLRPFVSGTLGATHFDPEDQAFDAETRFSLGFGGGMKAALTRHLGVRLEARGVSTFLNSGGTLFCGDGACAISAGSSIFRQFEGRAGLIMAF